MDKKSKSKKRLNNKGLSTVIVTLIIILISLVAIGVFWVVVQNLIKGSSENIGLEKLTVSASILGVRIDNSSNNVTVSVKRNVGSGNLVGMKFVFYNGSYTEIVTESTELKELQEKIFNFNLVMNASTLTTISIVPVFGSETGEENTGNVVDIFDVKTGKKIETIVNPPTGNQTCTPAVNPCAGRTCGIVQNGTCGNVSCGFYSNGSCQTGQTCNATGQCVSGACVPTTCAALGYNCGTWNNGTCGTMNCGTCSGGQTCNSTGTCVVQSTPSLNATPITCSLLFGADCGAWDSGCLSETDNTLDTCITCAGSTSDEHVDEAMVNGTTFAKNSTVNITCIYDPYNTQSIEYLSIRYPNTSWQSLYFAAAPAEPLGAINSVSVSWTDTSQTGEYWVRCSIKFQGALAEECPTGSYVDNDDVSFTVV